MAPVRFACFLALLLFTASLSNIGHIIASQDGNAVAELDAVSTGKGREVFFAGTEGVENRLGRRKMEVPITVMNLDEKAAERKGGIGGTIEISTTTQFAGKCNEINEENEGSNVECKHGVSSPSVHEKVDHDEAGFVAFNADYHSPRHHPPKNN